MIRILGTMREEIITKAFIVILLFFIVSCGDIPKEGKSSEKVEAKVELKYDNGTTRLGPLIEYIVLDY